METITRKTMLYPTGVEYGDYSMNHVLGCVLHEAGYKTWVSMEPYPTPNIIEQSLTDILNSVSFVGKIIFGRWNYSKEVHAYPAQKEFYNKTAEQVKRFCEKHGIECRIKKGTLT